MGADDDGEKETKKGRIDDTTQRCVFGGGGARGREKERKAEPTG